MKTIRVHGASLAGLEAFVVTVEARAEKKKEEAPEFHLTGLPDPILRETRGRLLCILRSAGIWLEPLRIHLNLVPAGRKKSGEALDLALVLAAATAAGHLDPRSVSGTVFLGEVGIDGRLHAVPGGLSAAVAAREFGITRVVAPPATAEEAAALDDVLAFGARTLREVLAHLTSAPGEQGPLAPMTTPLADPRASRDPSTLDEIHGQAEGKLALQVAAAGGHGLLYVGPPGAGKSMLARRLIDLLPAMTLEERVDVTRILSATGRWPRGLASRRPFRAPHHTTSFAGLLGGGSPIAPGEITLAHGGVLFMDELPEFGRDTLEGLRQPLEDGEVSLARASRRTTLPARFQLVAAMNPCPCGYHGHGRVPCHCAPSAVRRYRQRISGPLLDRIDLRVALQPAPARVLIGGSTAADRAGIAGEDPEIPSGPTGAAMGAAVLGARHFAAQRAAQGARPNAWLDAAQLDRVAPLNRDAAHLLASTADERHLSARGIQAIRRVARTAADLRGEEEIGAGDVATAIALRGDL